jgi:hypothetical protein
MRIEEGSGTGGWVEEKGYNGGTEWRKERKGLLPKCQICQYRAAFNIFFNSYA